LLVSLSGKKLLVSLSGKKLLVSLSGKKFDPDFCSVCARVGVPFRLRRFWVGLLVPCVRNDYQK